MKTKLDMAKILEGYIRSALKEHKWLNEFVEHFDCQDTDGDGNVECYFYIPEYKIEDSPAPSYWRDGRINKGLAEMLGVECVNCFEGPDDLGHKGEYRWAYTVNLKSE